MEPDVNTLTITWKHLPQVGNLDTHVNSPWHLSFDDGYLAVVKHVPDFSAWISHSSAELVPLKEIPILQATTAKNTVISSCLQCSVSNNAPRQSQENTLHITGDTVREVNDHRLRSRR